MATNFIIAQAIGLIALIILMLSFQKNDKKILLKYQMFSSLLYAVQYIFLSAYTGALMNLTCMVRNYIFNKYQDRKPPIYWLIIIIILMIIQSIVTYSGAISLLPMFAVVFYSIAVWYGNLKFIRITEIISCSLFIIYNITVLAIIGLIATIIELLGALVALIRFDIRKEGKYGREGDNRNK